MYKNELLQNKLLSPVKSFVALLLNVFYCLQNTYITITYMVVTCKPLGRIQLFKAIIYELILFLKTNVGIL